MRERIIQKLPEVDDVRYDEVLNIEAGVLFCDMKGFTILVSESDPKTIARIMTIYITEMVSIIRSYGGKILSIRGDGIIGIFSNSDKESAPDTIIKCAVSMSTSLKYVVNKRIESFKRTGISCRFW